MMTRKTFVLALSAFFFCLSLLGLASCNSGGKKSGQAPFAVALEGSPINLDPRLAMDAYSARVIQIVYNGLLKKTPESTLAGDLAERWEMPDDTSYIFTLRKGVKFHDGTDLTAEDVAVYLREYIRSRFSLPSQGFL